MKSYPTVRNIILFITAALLTDVTSGCGNKATGGVSIIKHEVEDLFIIHPGTKLRETDEQAFYDVLKNYDKKLYRIEKREPGKEIKIIGEFKIDGQSQSELARLGVTDCTDSTVICDVGAIDRASENLTFTEIETGKKLIAEIKPILEKYTRR